MQIIQTINDTIRILFSPLDEDFKLLDFLLVQEADNKYLAQIIEIYDDKYDASQNVARVKLFFKVSDKGEVSGYDHFTPSKECEIKKIKREEILTFINEDKESLTIGLDYQSAEPFDINLDFLKNNLVIFADKLDHSNNISVQIASTLSRYKKHSVIFDFSGTLEIKTAKKLKITKDIKLPLDFYTINYIWEKGLATASLETQAICREIFNEVQTFAKNVPEGFIAFDKFLKVVEAQYNATPIIELTVLLNKLKGYQKDNIFANSKSDFNKIQESCKENDITIIDFSELKTTWHKEFCEFVIRNVKNAFVFTRLNEINTDVDLINFIYDKNPDIYFIPSISYTFSKMPHIIERADNFVLLPTLNPRRDFGAANFELSSISQDECILFGKNTENFIFTIKNNKFTDETDNDTETKKTIKLKFHESPKRDNSLKEKFKNRATSEDEPEDDILNQMPTEEELEFFEQLEFENETEDEKIPAKKSDDSSAFEHYKEATSQIEETQEPVEEDVIDEPVLENSAEEPLEQIAEIEETQEPVEEDVIDEPVLEDIVDEPVEQIAEIEETQEPVEEDVIDEPVEEDIVDEPVGFQNLLEETKELAYSAEESVSLEDLATQSIEDTFNEAIGDSDKNKTPETENNKDKLVIDENVVIDLEKIKEHIDTEKGNELPLFKNEIAKKAISFKNGDIVEHDKYGQGEVVKVINYANRSLLQINFKEVGKRLLDPEIANIKKAESN